jgi:hypothetical protein
VPVNLDVRELVCFLLQGEENRHGERTEKETYLVKLDGSKGEAQLKVWHKSAWAVVHRPTHQRRLS